VHNSILLGINPLYRMRDIPQSKWGITIFTDFIQDSSIKLFLKTILQFNLTNVNNLPAK